MNDQTVGAEASKTTSLSKVQTSAQAQTEVAHKEPALGGSYIRNLETGDLVKQEPAKEKNDQE